MGASLRYAKIVDRERFVNGGGTIRPSLDNGIRLVGEAPARARPFYILRAWDHFDSFTETWRIVEPHGRTVRVGLAREVLEAHQDLADEIDDAEFEYTADDYQLVLEVDGREVARADFPVQEPPD